ncbi:MAG: hypothetical protein VSS75_026655 [Candidatus Parabeggiatoa sp.]|nr:hypothetical protein [Candidatus Parabeggiatoa sp.]
MKVIIERPVFTDPSIDESDLITLLRLGYQGRHYILTEPAWSPSNPLQEIDDCLKQQSLKLYQECQLALEFGLEEILHPSSFTVRVSCEKKTSRNNEVVLPLNEAVNFLTLPFKILVEDAIRDRDFLFAIATVNQELKKELDDLYNKKWIEFENGGGLTHMQQRLQEIRRDKQDKMRIWVMFDSDALRPRYPSDDSEKLKRICENAIIPYHQLQRRAIENYLPVHALTYWVRKKVNNTQKNQHLVNAFEELRSKQRHHFNMKNGFQGDQNRTDKNRVGDLYDDLDDDTRSKLSHGFGGKIAELFKDKSAIKDSWLINDEQRVETEAMLNTLLSLI